MRLPKTLTVPNRQRVVLVRNGVRYPGAVVGPTKGGGTYLILDNGCQGTWPDNEVERLDWWG